jgi:hypothetical protein
LSEKRHSFLRPLKNKGFKKESMTKVGLYAISTSTTLESNKSRARNPHATFCGSRRWVTAVGDPVGVVVTSPCYPTEFGRPI